MYGGGCTYYTTLYTIYLVFLSKSHFNAYSTPRTPWLYLSQITHERSQMLGLHQISSILEFWIISLSNFILFE